MTLPTPERSLLADALGIAEALAEPLGREPLGSGAVAGFRVGAGDEAAVYYVDTSGTRVRAETGLAADGVRIWLHPADPHLPALPPVAFGDAAAIVLARLGIAALGPPELVAYRPGRRAVVRVAVEGGSVWIKVVPPGRTERVHATHVALAAAGVPVPTVLGWAPEGLLVLASAEGVPATEASWHPGDLLDVADDVRARFARAALPHAARGHALARLPWYRSRFAGSSADARRAHAIADRAAGLLAEPAGRPAGVHGDLHLGQLFVIRRGAVLQTAGVVDVDTAGTGDPADDAAAFVAHAVASALLTEANEARARVSELAELGRERWLRTGRARAGTAVHLLGHALAAAGSGLAAHADALLGAAEAVAVDDRPLLSRS